MAFGDMERTIGRQIERLGPGEWLPSDAQLAREYGVSIRTMRRLMSRLKAKGVVVRVRGKGTHKPYRVEGPGDMPRWKPKRNVAEELFLLLRESIKNGEFRRGDVLPQAKFFRLQHGVSDRTVREAYARLCDSRLVTKIGRRYSVGAFSPKNACRHLRTVLMVVASPADLPRIYTSYERSPAYWKLERELRANGFTIKYVCRDDIPAVHQRYRRLGKSPDGMIFFRLDGRDIDLIHDAVYPFARRCDAELDFPVLVDLQSYARTDQVPYKLNIVSQGNFHTAQARGVAGLLARYPSPWSVVVFEEERLRSNPQTSYLRFFKMVYETILARKSVDNIALVLLSEDGGATRDGVLAAVTEKYSSYFGYLDDKYSRRTGITARRLHERLTVAADFESILGRFGNNAIWLCATDELTDAALRCCRALSLEVPREISVLSLENSPAYYHLCASACAPDWDLIGYLMAHSIVGDFPLNKTSHGYLRIPCSVIHRSTTLRVDV